MYTIKLYYNTGFNHSNVPDSPQLVETLPSGTYNMLPLLQNRWLSMVRVEVDSFNAIKNVDYAVIGDVMYFVTGVTMENETTATLTLEEDIIGTTGVGNIDIISGWTIRRNYTAAEDTYGANLLAEPWQPQNTPVMNFYPNIFGINTGAMTYLVLSSVALTSVNGWDTAMSFTDGTDNVLIPRLPYISDSLNDLTTFSMGYNVYAYPCKIPNVAAYDLTTTNVMDGVNKCRSLGVESAIRGSYIIPTAYVTIAAGPGTASDPGRIPSISGKTGFATGANPIYGNVENKKAIMLYNFYTISNLSSGANTQYPIYDIWSGSGSPQFIFSSDPLPSGTVYCRPLTYKGNTPTRAEEFFIGAVQGAPWQNNEILWKSPSGWAVTKSNMDVIREYANANFQRDTKFGLEQYQLGAYEQAANSLGSTGVGGLKGRVMNAPQDVASRVMIGNQTGNYSPFNIEEMQNQLFQSQYIYNLTKSGDEFRQSLITNQRNANVEWLNVDVAFPYGANVQSYMNNSFDLITTHLSADDLQRFDLFLHQFGYACSEKLISSHLTNRSKFNYIQTTDAQVKCGRGVHTNSAIATILNNGVRIWHTQPSAAAMAIGGN